MTAGYFLTKKDAPASMRQTTWGPGELNRMFWSFKLKHSRWPKNIDEFKAYVQTNDDKKGLDLASFQNLKFTETPKKTLQVHFDGYKNGNDSAGLTDEEINISLTKKESKGS